MAVNNVIKRIQKAMRKDPGVNGDAQRMEEIVWMIFLKVYDAQEDIWEIKAYREGKTFQSIIPEKYRWRNWAIDKRDGEALTGDALLSFVNEGLFTDLKGLETANMPRGKALVKDVFEDINQYMKNGTILREVINIINEMDFNDVDDRHTFGDIYEGMLRDLQSAGNAGEFYTPRALTDFIIDRLDPKLGESFGDFTSGTGGFLTSVLNHIAPMIKSAADQEKYQKAVIGQEWKPLPYILSVTNLLLHDVEAPNIRHCDSLAIKVEEIPEENKVDVIGMNPPYGGSTEASVKDNFLSRFQSSETADLFLVLIMKRLKAGGRAGVIIPDGFLFGTDGAKYAIKEELLRKFNLHTVIRLPGSIFAPYTSIATNILFFDNETADLAPEGFRTRETWFYRLDMPEGYKHFSKTKPMRLEHCRPIMEWWNNRQELITDDDVKAKCFSVQDLMAMDCNFDQCKFPKDEEEVLPPDELLRQYWERRAALDHEIDSTLAKIEELLGIHIAK